MAIRLLHLAWEYKTTFYNKGKLMLWIESASPLLKKDDFYLYQERLTLLQKVAQDYFQSHIFKPSILELDLPLNKKNEAIPSPLIANILAFEDTEVKSNATKKINALEINDPLLFLKELNFIKNYFDSNLQLANDAYFWIEVAKELSAIIKRDQYVPYIIATKNKNDISYSMKWKPLISEQNNNINHLMQAMPYSSCSVTNAVGINAIENFAESLLNDFVNNTKQTIKLYSQIKNTLLDYATFLPRGNSITQQQYESWRCWFENLAYNQLGLPFKLCIRLDDPNDEAGKWLLNFSLQSTDDPSFMVDLATYFNNKLQKKKIYQKMFGGSVERNMLLQLGYASRLYSPIDRLFNAGLSASKIELSKDEALRFLTADAWVLYASGYNIIVPAWWTQKGRLKAKIKLTAKKQTTQQTTELGYLNYTDIAKFDYTYAIGGEKISAKQWQELVNAKSDLVFFRGQWITIDPKEMQHIQKLIDTYERDKTIGNVTDILEMSANEELFDLDLDESLEKMMLQLVNKTKISTLNSPDNLQAILRPYQTRGLSWLVYLESIGINPCLADDMGLGKTIQVIALLLTKKMLKPALLVVPTSVIGSWDKEINRFAPSLSVYIHHGSNKKSKSLDDVIKQYNLIITSFGLLRRDSKLFQEQNWSRIIVDEAQNIKNPSASQTKALCNLISDSKIALTGTPVENRLMDLWSIFNFLNPGYLGNKAVFRKKFELPIQKEGNILKANMLKKMIEPFILRRLKTDKNIIKDLPDKIEQKVYCQLTKEQASIYQTIVDETKDKLNDSDKNSKKDKTNIFILSILKLKQTCNHPSQILQDGSLFSANRSIKLQRLLEMAEEIILNKESLLIFSQFTEICSQLEQVIRQQYGYMVYYLHGGTTRKKREAMIEQFQNSKSEPAIFILSLKAGGVGITLTKANHVIHFDRWWNPAVENQATDRAYRIGQQKKVLVYKYITIGTIEESIDKMLENKQRVSDMVVGGDESWLSKLDNKSFLDLIELKNTEEL